VLEVQALDAAYGELRALVGVGVEVGTDEIVALVGSNGAGKTTLLRCIAGLTRPRAGRVRWQGEDLTAIPPHRVVERGVAMVPEGRRLFGHMTVEENLVLGAFSARAHPERQATLRRVYEIFPRLAERRRQLAGALSGGEQQMVAIGRALMTRPRLLMLDEPSLGLAPRVVEAMLRVLEDINRAGVGVFLVEQNVRAALGLAHRAYVLEHGRIVGQGRSADILADPDVRRAYLGPLAVEP
jgi:branched-chain amino acid transport system ATP-binding protein